MRPPDTKALGQMPDSKTVGRFVSQNAIYIVLLLLICGIALQDASFLSLNNLRNILTSVSTRAIIALGVGGILITRGTDLGIFFVLLSNTSTAFSTTWKIRCFSRAEAKIIGR